MITVQVAIHHFLPSCEFDVCRCLFFAGGLSAEHIVFVFVTKTAMNNSFSIWQLHGLRHQLVNKELGRIFFFFFALARFGFPLECCLFVKECYNGEALKKKKALAHMMTRLCSDQTTHARRQITQHCLLIMRGMSANQMTRAQTTNHLQVLRRNSSYIHFCMAKINSLCMESWTTCRQKVAFIPSVLTLQPSVWPASF